MAIKFRVFELTNGGTLREPLEKKWGEEAHVFDHYDGYDSSSAAEEDIKEARNKRQFYGDAFILMVEDGRP
jgi:hypothetical protein